MLGHADGDRWQLLDLMTRRVVDGDQLGLAEHMPAATAPRPVIDELVNRPRRQQRPALALMTGLGTLVATRPILPAPRCAARRVLAGRLRRVARVATKPPLQLGDALLLLGHALAQRLDLRVHPQQYGHNDLTTLPVDRLRLGPLHTTRFDASRLCPPTHRTLTRFGRKGSTTENRGVPGSSPGLAMAKPRSHRGFLLPEPLADWPRLGSGSRR